MEKTKKFGLIASGLLFLYLLTCIPNSIKLNKKINPVRQEFRTEAQTGYTIKTIWGGFDDIKILDYGGNLNTILEKRDEFLKTNYGISLPWRTSLYYDGNEEKIETITLPVICYNPLHKIN